MDKIFLWHPLLFAILFVIMPFTQYAGLIPSAQIAAPFIVICVFALLLYFIIKSIVKKAGAAVALLSPLLVTLFNYGILYEYISSLTSGTKLKGPFLILATLIILVILTAYIFRVLRAHDETIRNVNKLFFMLVVALILFNTYSISMQSIASAKVIDGSRRPDITLPKKTGPLPDIYFIILDEYAAPSQTKSYFNYDMSPFVAQLKQKGFMVTEMYTDSLSTSAIMENRLNMALINRKDSISMRSSLSESLFENMNLRNTRDENSLIHIRNNKIILYLKSLGYQYVHMGSWFAATRYNQLADENINCYGFQFRDELSTIILNNSVLRLVLINKYFIRTSVLDAFAVLGNMPVIDGKPKFVFAHIICPHTPYVFGPNGERLGVFADRSKNQTQLYLDQHTFITKKVKEFVDHKLSASQASSVFIIQADHGARTDKAGAHQVFSAIYIPNYKGTPYSQDATNSVNTFKFVLNQISEFSH